MLTHIIRSGNNFSLLSDQYKCSIKYLMCCNPDKKVDSLQLGDKLYIPEYDDKFIIMFCLFIQFIIRWIINPLISIYHKLFPQVLPIHKIKEGDTFSDLCQKYGYELEDLISVNPGVIPEQLQIDQIINLPTDKTKNFFTSFLFFVIRIISFFIAKSPIST